MTEQQQAAMRQALEALSASDDFLFNYHDCEPNNEREVDAYSEVRGNNMKAWEAIREALAEQPAQQQEPVAWITNNGKGWLRWHKPQDSEKNKDSIPLYTSPPASKPLTDEQCDAIYTALDQWAREFDQYEFGLPSHCGDGMVGGRKIIRRAIEAKLKEKNT